MSTSEEPTTKFTKAEAPPTLADATDMVWHKTVVHVYPVVDSKLEELTSGYNSLYLVFFGICIGAAISLFIAFKETTAVSQKPYYLACFIATLGVGVISGIAGLSNFIKANRTKKKLYNESVVLDPGKVK